MGKTIFYLPMIVSECLLIKDENEYLQEHLERDIDAGISHFYIYDNYSKVPVEEFIKNNIPQYYDKCTFNLLDKEECENIQLYCYKHFLDNYRDETDWVSFTDTDEIFTGNLCKLCSDNMNYYALQFYAVTHGCNGHVYQDSNELFNRFDKDDSIRVGHWKFVVQPKYIKSQGPHSIRIYDNCTLRIKEVYKNCGVILHHFYYKSFEEWIKKILRGCINKKSSDERYINIDKFLKNNRRLPIEDVNKLLDKYGVTLDTRQKY